MRSIFIIILTCFLSTLAVAEEKITNFDVTIDVQKNGDIVVTETIEIIKESRHIHKGIFRDLPRFYTDDTGKLTYRYDVVFVKRNGKKEKYEQSKEGDTYRVKIGNEKKTLVNGPHIYELQYRVKNQVRYFEKHDEIYWNVTGNYWAFPIAQAAAHIRLPLTGFLQAQNAYTGAFGVQEQNYNFTQAGRAYNFNTTKPLNAREGFTVSLRFEKGLIDPPSEADKRAYWWMKNGALFLLSFSFLGVLGYYMFSWNKVGRDPLKGPVFPRYKPPNGCSPAAAHKVLYKEFRGHKALIATLMGLAIKKQITLETHKKETIITLVEPRGDTLDLTAEEQLLLDALFVDVNVITLTKKTNHRLMSAYRKFTKYFNEHYGEDYHKYNLEYVLGGIGLSVAAVFIAANQIIARASLPFIVVIGGLVIANIIFMLLMPAPSPKGQNLKGEIKGFKLYLETAEKLRLNTAEPDMDTLPAMSVEHYEFLLPYAIALNVEDPWTKYFEKQLPQEAKHYRLNYTGSNFNHTQSLNAMNKSFVSSLNSGVSHAMPASSSGASGSSGGGGGGGGGGGW